MRKLVILLAGLWSFNLGTPSSTMLYGITDEEKKQKFIKAREEMRTIPASPSPGKKTTQVKPKPKTAGRPSPQPTVKSTPQPSPDISPKESPSPGPTPKLITPKITPKSTTSSKSTPKSIPKPSKSNSKSTGSSPKSSKSTKPKQVPSKPPSSPIPTPHGFRAVPELRSTPIVSPTPTPLVTPTPAPLINQLPAPVVIQKSGLEEETGLAPAPPKQFWSWSRSRWNYLSKSVRDEIDKANVKKRRWRYIVVHNSGTRQGNAKIFDYYHRKTRKMPNGLAYHFVIGNGTSSGDGQIEVGSRWQRQVNGGHVHSDYLNNISLGICLVGDYNRDTPSRAQLEALDELIRYLRLRVGKIERKFAIVKAHKNINPPAWPTDCPGDKFPFSWLKSKFE